eukprot:scpid91442/ scgid12224/ Mitochondrial cardiolipin hydrolase; Phospholipase D6 homolog
MGNCFGGRGSDEADGNAYSSSRGTIQQVLMFPDKAMPCRYGRSCRRGNSCSYSHENTSLKQFLARLSSAKRSIDVCVFTITCNEIADTLLEQHRKNVAVRIISDGEQLHSQGSDVQRMARAGIPVRLGREENSLMHHKFAVLDRNIIVTGSFNWTRHAVLHNRENIFISDLGQMRQPYIGEFDKLWREYSGNVLR